MILVTPTPFSPLDVIAFHDHSAGLP